MEPSARKGVTHIIMIKIAIQILGVIIIGVGIHSRYHSSWLTHNVPRRNLNISVAEAEEFNYNETALKPSQVCQIQNMLISWGWTPMEMDPCPEMILEDFFIIVIILSFCITLIGGLLMMTRVVTLDMYCWQILEVCYHGIFSVIIFAAGVAYIHSANEIVTFVKPQHADVDFMNNLLTNEKIVAGALTIIQAVLYGIVSGLVGHRLQY